MKPQTKARQLQGSNNKGYALEEFFDNKNRLKCTECGCLLDPYYRTLRIDFKSKFDFSTTYDHVDIVSKRFKEYVQSEGYSNVIFFPVNERNDFFYFHVLNNVVLIDIEKSGIIHDRQCNTCFYPRNIYGGSEIYLSQSEPLSDGFFNTDIYWRTHNVFGPRVFIGLETYEKIKAQKFTGLDMYRKIY